MNTHIQAFIGHILEDHSLKRGLIAIATEYGIEPNAMGDMRDMYSCILDVFQSGKPPTRANVVQQAGKYGLTGNLSKKIDELRDTSHAVAWHSSLDAAKIETIKYHADHIGDRLKGIRHSRTVNADLEAILQDAQDRLTFGPVHTTMTNDDVQEATKQRIQNAAKHTGCNIAHPVEFLDRCYKGHESGLHLTAGRPKQGKTSFEITVALEIAKAGEPVGVASMEMTSERLNRTRLLPNHMRRDTYPLSAGHASDMVMDEAYRACDGLKGLPLYWSPKSMTLQELKNWIRTVNLQHGVRYFLIDHIRAVRKEDYRQSEFEYVTQNADELSALAVEIDVVLKAICHLRRPEGSSAKWPDALNELKGSGKLEEVAETVLVLGEPTEEMLRNDGLTSFPPPDITYIGVEMAVNRSGGTARKISEYDGARNLWSFR